MNLEQFKNYIVFPLVVSVISGLIVLKYEYEEFKPNSENSKEESKKPGPPKPYFNINEVQQMLFKIGNATSDFESRKNLINPVLAKYFSSDCSVLFNNDDGEVYFGIQDYLNRIKDYATLDSIKIYEFSLNTENKINSLKILEEHPTTYNSASFKY